MGVLARLMYINFLYYPGAQEEYHKHTRRQHTSAYVSITSAYDSVPGPQDDEDKRSREYRREREQTVYQAAGVLLDRSPHHSYLLTRPRNEN